MSTAEASHLRENPFELAKSQLRMVGEIFALDPKSGSRLGAEDGRVAPGLLGERVRQLETRALRELRNVAPSLELYLRT